MKITRQYLVGRYVNPATGRAVNIHKGRCDGGWDRYFYYRRQKKILVDQSFRNWEKEQPKFS